MGAVSKFHLGFYALKEEAGAAYEAAAEKLFGKFKRPKELY